MRWVDVIFNYIGQGGWRKHTDRPWAQLDYVCALVDAKFPWFDGDRYILKRWLANMGRQLGLCVLRAWSDQIPEISVGHLCD